MRWWKMKKQKTNQRPGKLTRPPGIGSWWMETSLSGQESKCFMIEMLVFAFSICQVDSDITTFTWWLPVSATSSLQLYDTVLDLWWSWVYEKSDFWTLAESAVIVVLEGERELKFNTLRDTVQHTGTVLVFSFKEGKSWGQSLVGLCVMLCVLMNYSYNWQHWLKKYGVSWIRIFDLTRPKKNYLVVLHRPPLIFGNWKKSFYCTKVYCP